LSQIISCSISLSCFRGAGLKNGIETCTQPRYRKNTHFDYLSSALLLALAACSSGRGSGAKTSNERIIIAGRPEQTADMPIIEKPPTKPDTKPEDKDPPDKPVIATTRPQITLVLSDEITAPALTEGARIASGAEIFMPMLATENLNLTYELLDTGDSPLFQLVEETGSLSFKTDTIPDFETRKKGYQLSYRASSDDLVFTQQIHIPIRDIDEAPDGMRVLVRVGTIPEDNQKSVKLADIEFEDEDRKPAFQANIASISDNPFFEIRNGDELWLKPDAPLDYETARRHEIIIHSDNSTHQKRFVLSIKDVDEIPVIEQFVLNISQREVFEGVSSAMHLSTAFLIGKDGLRIDDDKITIEIQDSLLFEIRKNNQLWLKDKVELDFENALDRVHNITVWVSGAPHLSKKFTLVLSNIDEKPSAIVISPVRARVDEGLTASIKLAEISFKDDALGSNYLFLTGEKKDKFELRADGLYLATGAEIDFEERGGSQLRVTVDIHASGQRLAEFALPQSIALRVTNIDEPGQFAAWTGYPVIGGTLIAPVLSDPDGRITNLTYQWQSQILGQEWQDILYAETAEYTPRPEDIHKFLRVIAFYDDREGAGKSAISDITDSVNEVTNTARNAPSMPVETPLYGEEIYGEEIYGLEQMVDIL